jgi:hypothetical protein
LEFIIYPEVMLWQGYRAKHLNVALKHQDLRHLFLEWNQWSDIFLPPGDRVLDGL